MEDNNNASEIVVDKKSKILFAVFGVLILISAGITYYKIMVKRDYQIYAQVSCNPHEENCFVSECDPEEDETCSENPEERISYFKYINKNASNVVICDSNKGEKCSELKCEADEPNCEYTLCDPDNLEEGEQCNSG